MTVVPAVTLVSSVSLAISVSCCCDSGAFGAPSVIGVRSCFCEVLG